MARALADLTKGLRHPYDPAADLSRMFDPPSDNPVLVLVRGIPFTTLCEHHWLPFTGSATVAYLPRPGGKVVGLSKLARVVAGFASAPTMQERLGEQVTQALMDHLDADGAGCVLSAVHTCMTLRGPRTPGAVTVTSHLRGRFYEAPMRQEFLSLAERNGT
jgi:GTP cyclohydrolase I